jgi:hypothetical protein
VHVAALVNGADLDPRHELEARVAGEDMRGIAAAGRVVIGDADDGQACGAGPENELRRRERAVGGGRVQMEVDQRLVKR